MKRLLREPLMHFLLLGAAIFAIYGLVSQPAISEPGKIVITQGQLASMRATFILTWQRPPTHEEWEGLVRDRVREEVYVREALALGLDRDDTIIRRRLRQKMEFITDNAVAQAQPTDDDLRAYLLAHPDKFKTEQRFTFHQVFLNPAKHGENLARDSAKLLAQLNRAGSSADTSVMGDSVFFDDRFVMVPTSEVVRQFGRDFATKLSEIPRSQWVGPIESGFGVHLVRIDERTEGGPAALADIRDAIRREWENARRLEANEKFYQALLKRYSVTIESPQPADNKRSRL